MNFRIAGVVALFASMPVGADDPAALRRPADARVELRGRVGELVRRVQDRWLLSVPDANPAILDMFRDRDRRPLRALEPWAGEFAGKYLTGGTQVYRLTRDEALKTVLTRFVAELVATPATDGYLGPWPAANRLTGMAPDVGRDGVPGGTWDAWGHYHALIGLLLWHEETGDPAALACARRIGDLFGARFAGGRKPRLVDPGSAEMNLAPAHGMAVLHRFTHDPRHWALAEQFVGEFAARDPAGKPLAGDYVGEALRGKEFFQCPKPRRESLHPIMTLAEPHATAKNDDHRRAFEQWWWSIVKLDRHDNGGFSSGEQAQGNPYHRGAIETCCTVAWLALSVEMLRLTGRSVVADELELTTLNSGMGLHSPSGRWSAYDTPMDGVRKASAHDIVFQARAGSPELNCCSVNAARALGLISD